MSSFDLLVKDLSIDGNYDLKNPKFKHLVDKLTSLTWDALHERINIKNELLIELINKNLESPLIASRLKDIYFILYFREFLTEGSIYDLLEDMNNTTIKRYNGYSHCKSKLVYFGMVKIARGSRYDGIFDILKANQEYFQNNITTAFLSYARSISPPTHFEYTGHQQSPAITSNHQQSPAITKTAIIVAGDEVYVKRYLIRYIESLNKNLNINIDFILCCIGKENSLDVECTNIINKAREIYSGGLFILDYIEPPEYKDIRSYYACVRFIQAKKHLTNRESLIITDLDYQLSRPELLQFITALRKHSLAINENIDNVQKLFPWLKYTAGTVYVRNDSAGHTFLDAFKTNFKKNYNANCFNWGIDQNILFSVIESLKTSGVHVANIKKIGEPFTVPYDIKKK